VVGPWVVGPWVLGGGTIPCHCWDYPVPLLGLLSRDYPGNSPDVNSRSRFLPGLSRPQRSRDSPGIAGTVPGLQIVSRVRLHLQIGVALRRRSFAPAPPRRVPHALCTCNKHCDRAMGCTCGHLVPPRKAVTGPRATSSGPRRLAAWAASVATLRVACLERVAMHPCMLALCAHVLHPCWKGLCATYASPPLRPTRAAQHNMCRPLPAVPTS
jgi:hypothetical protein